MGIQPLKRGTQVYRSNKETRHDAKKKKNVCTRCTEIVPTLAVNTREIITDLTVIPTYTVPEVQVSEKGSGEHTLQISV